MLALAKPFKRLIKELDFRPIECFRLAGKTRPVWDRIAVYLEWLAIFIWRRFCGWYCRSANSVYLLNIRQTLREKKYDSPGWSGFHRLNLLVEQALSAKRCLLRTNVREFENKMSVWNENKNSAWASERMDRDVRELSKNGSRLHWHCLKTHLLKKLLLKIINKVHLMNA